MLRQSRAGEPAWCVLPGTSRRGEPVPAKAFHPRAEGPRSNQRVRTELSGHRRDALRRRHGGSPAPGLRRSPRRAGRPGPGGQAGQGGAGARARLLPRDLLCDGDADPSGRLRQVGTRQRLEVVGHHVGGAVRRAGRNAIQRAVAQALRLPRLRQQQGDSQQRNPAAPGGSGHLLPANLPRYQQRGRAAGDGPGDRRLGRGLPDRVLADSGWGQRGRRCRYREAAGGPGRCMCRRDPRARPRRRPGLVRSLLWNRRRAQGAGRRRCRLLRQRPSHLAGGCRSQATRRLGSSGRSE